MHYQFYLQSDKRLRLNQMVCLLFKPPVKCCDRKVSQTYWFLNKLMQTLAYPYA